MKNKLLTIASMSTGLILFGQTSVRSAGGSLWISKLFNWASRFC